MLGYTQPNNNIYIFFEDDEIEKLEQKKIRGIYFNLNDLRKKGLLEVSINNQIELKRMNTSVNKDSKGFVNLLQVEIRSIVYKEIKKDGLYEEHESFRHICFRDANTLDFYDKSNYNQLKYWENLDFIKTKFQ